MFDYYCRNFVTWARTGDRPKIRLTLSSYILARNTVTKSNVMARGKLRVIELSAGVEGLELTEGAAKVHLKKDQGVFYNPVQCFNRDIRYLHETLDESFNCMDH